MRLAGAPEDIDLFAIGDVHGQADVFEMALKRISEKDGNGRERVLVLTGDLIDRGPGNLRTLSLFQLAGHIAKVDRVVFLPGNHELMMLDSIREPDRFMSHWVMNGGRKVLSELFPEGVPCQDEVVSKLQHALEWYIEQINDAPTHFRADGLLFVHAGIHPRIDQDKFLSLPKDQAVLYPDHWAWIRDDFLYHEGGWGAPTQTVIHGHTMACTDYMDHARIIERMDKTATHHRICLDAGAATVGQVGVLSVISGEYDIEIMTDRPCPEPDRPDM